VLEFEDETEVTVCVTVVVTLKLETTTAVVPEEGLSAVVTMTLHLGPKKEEHTILACYQDSKLAWHQSVEYRWLSKSTATFERQFLWI
jgi:hypothetical protein